MEPKFKKGDIARVLTSGQQVLVIEYKISRAGGIVNYLTGTTNYPDPVRTSLILCEWRVKDKATRKYLQEVLLEFVNPVKE